MTAAPREIYELAVARDANGDLESALKGYLRASEMLPHDMDVAYRAASALLRSGQLQAAQSRLRRIIFADPTHLDARASLANCQLLLNELDLSEKNFREVLDQSPDHKNALYGLAKLLVDGGRAKAAFPFIHRLSVHLPDSVSAQTLTAEALDQSGDSAQAVATYRKLLKDNSDHVPALLGLARTLLKTRRFDEVIALTVRAAEIDPDEAIGFDMMSQALEGRENLEDALEAATEAHRLAPDDIGYMTRLSILHRKLGQYPEALAAALKACDAAPGDRAPVNALGAALAALKYAKEARAVLTGTGKAGLDPDIRKLAERLSCVPEPGSITTAQSKPQPETATSSLHRSKTTGTAQDMEQNNLETGQKPDVADQATSGSFLAETPVSRPAIHAGNDEPLPNVLGLARRDRS